MPRPRSWTDDDLRRAVAEARTYKEVGEKLGLRGSSGSEVAIRVRMAELGLQTVHLEAARRARRTAQARARRSGRPRSETKPGRSRSWSDEDLKRAVARSRSYAQVLRELGLKPGGDVYVALTRRITELDLDTSHMTRQGWAKGVQNPARRAPRPLAELLVAESDCTRTHELKMRLFKEGLKEQSCECCGISEWNGLPAPLQLDHANGDRRDNRLQNLRILCANCHAQTDTWCGRNIGRYENLQ